MAFCKFEAEIDAKGYMTAPLEKGPMPRWHKKLKDSRKLTPLSPLNIGPGCDSRPSGKTPAKSSSSKSKTPKSNKTKGSSAALSNYDRFIPNRALMDVEKSHHLLVKIENVNEDEEDKNLSDVEFEERMNANLGVTDARILTVSHKAPQAKEGIYYCYYLFSFIHKKMQNHLQLQTIPPKPLLFYISLCITYIA